MRLLGVTITGADDAVDPRALVAMSEFFPFVEWGILLSERRQGSERYPSEEWLNKLRIVVARAPGEVKLSLHLCGALSRLVMQGDASVLAEYPIAAYCSRVQLNGFSQTLPGDLRLVRFSLNHEFILQVQTPEAWELSQRFPMAAIIWDRSGGCGVRESEWPDPPTGLPMTYAGGITPETVTSTVLTINAKPHKSGYRIDIETGARTNDRFDFNKVWDILCTAEPYIGRQEQP